MNNSGHLAPGSRLYPSTRRLKLLLGGESKDWYLIVRRGSSQTNIVKVVERNSAVLGYPCEQSSPLNADHSTICKFQDRADGNYTQVKNAIRMLISSCPSSNSE